MAAVLIIDDDKDVRRILGDIIRKMGHDADDAVTLRQGLEMASSRLYDVVFLDVRMPDGSGLDVISKLRAAPSAPEVIIMTGFGDENGAELAITNGAWDYIQKPILIRNIRLSLMRVFQYRENLKSVRKPDRIFVFNGVIGSSSVMNACLELARQASESEAGVLITGETGVGKELFADAIHQNSARSNGNFVVVDCAAMPETLVESVLFGHEKGAFTSAEARHTGLILQADQGTLFLDEVGELPVSIQKSFLRVLEEQRFRPIGGTRELRSRFRLIAATNRNLEAMTEEGTFRKDLLFRLKTLTIELPPLRLHSEDIPDIARYHLKKLCRNYGMVLKETSPDFMESLTAYPWPGNARELVHALERTLALASEEAVLFSAHLPPEIRIHAIRSSVRSAENKTFAASPCPDVETLSPPSETADFPTLKDFRMQAVHQAEEEYLLKLMRHTRGSIKNAMRVAGISRSRLFNLMKKHHISRLGW